jgi:hypothetical protein
MKTIFISIVLLFSLSFISCKKETTTLPKTSLEKILGKWKLVTTVTNDFYNGSSHLDTIVWQAGDYIDFRIDGKAYGYNSGSYDTTFYGIINNSKLWIDDVSYVFDIKILTESDLQVYRKEIISQTEYSEGTANAMR